jgi:hypothetical protein
VALTFTAAGLQAQLQLVADALDGGDVPQARIEYGKACALLTGLPAEVSSDGVVVKTARDTLARLEAVLYPADSSAALSASSTRRIIRAGFRHGS